MTNERRYVRASVIENTFRAAAKVIQEDGNDIYDKGWVAALESAADVVARAAVVDVVEVVRCGCCQFVETDQCPMSGTRGRVSASDFCSYGERRKEK